MSLVSATETSHILNWSTTIKPTFTVTQLRTKLGLKVVGRYCKVRKLICSAPFSISSKIK